MKNSEQPINPIVNEDGYCTSLINIQGEDAGAIGLTKREYFAGLAMNGLSAIDWDIPGEVIDKDKFTASMIARHSVMTADALITELEKPTK